jgi:hypothetical protein
MARHTIKKKKILLETHRKPSKATNKAEDIVEKKMKHYVKLHPQYTQNRAEDI